MNKQIKKRRNKQNKKNKKKEREVIFQSFVNLVSKLWLDFCNWLEGQSRCFFLHLLPSFPLPLPPLPPPRGKFKTPVNYLSLVHTSTKDVAINANILGFILPPIHKGSSLIVRPHPAIHRTRSLAKTT